MSNNAALNGFLRLLLPAAVLAVAAVMVLDRLALDQRVAERRALVERDTQLSVSALAPGSALACLDGSAGDATENACEAAVFASPQNTAAAVAYTGARLTLLADAYAFAQTSDKAAETGAFTGVRRALTLDRYGIAAHVLALRDGCTPERCAAFDWLGDVSALKANMKAQIFDQYVSRHSGSWNAPAAAKPPAVSEAPAVTAPEAKMEAIPGVKAATAEPPAGHPVSGKYDFPSAASIPPVSIMNAEPAVPKAAAEAQAAEPKAEAGTAVPVPQKRPQAQAGTSPAR